MDEQSLSYLRVQSLLASHLRNQIEHLEDRQNWDNREVLRLTSTILRRDVDLRNANLRLAHVLSKINATLGFQPAVEQSLGPFDSVANLWTGERAAVAFALGQESPDASGIVEPYVTVRDTDIALNDYYRCSGFYRSPDGAIGSVAGDGIPDGSVFIAEGQHEAALAEYLANSAPTSVAGYDERAAYDSTAASSVAGDGSIWKLIGDAERGLPPPGADYGPAPRGSVASGTRTAPWNLPGAQCD